MTFIVSPSVKSPSLSGLFPIYSTAKSYVFTFFTITGWNNILVETDIPETKILNDLS